jgi:hypothetical protein
MDFDTPVKLAIYRHFAETGRQPTVESVPGQVGTSVAAVLDAYARLRRQRMLVLEADGSAIRVAYQADATRLQEHSRRPQPDEMRSIFAGLGLEGAFWDAQSDRFG